MNEKIPIDEQANVLHVYWVMLSELEMTVKENDFIAKNIITGAYNVLNRIGYTKERPQFEKKNK